MPITQFTFDPAPATKAAEQRSYFQEVKGVFDTDETIINYTDIEESHILVVLNNHHAQKCNGGEQKTIAREAIKDYNFKAEHPSLMVVKSQRRVIKPKRDKDPEGGDETPKETKPPRNLEV